VETPNDREDQGRSRLAFLGVWTAGVLALAAISLAPPFLPIYAYLGYGLYMDNVLHFLVFAGMATLTPFAFGRVAFSGAVAILFMLAFVLEGMQFFIPGHRADPVDFTADVLGLAAGAALGLLIRRLATHKRVARSEQ
jgi:hypothetical protein